MVQFWPADPQTDYIIQLSYLPLLPTAVFSASRDRNTEDQAMQPTPGRRTVAPSIMKTRLLQATLVDSFAPPQSPLPSRLGMHSRRSNCLIGCDEMVAAVFLIPQLLR